MIVFAALLHRCLVASTTFPLSAYWAEMGLLLLVLAAVTASFGGFTGFFTRRFAPLSRQTVTLVLLGSFFSPALVEEFVFRVLPVPLTTEAGAENRLLWASVSLFVFVLYHPARAWILKKPHYRVFLDIRFLVLAALLGLFCTIVYFRSVSLWPCALTHWLFVVIWLVFLGGYERLHCQTKC